jgi:hemerythrin
MAQASSSPSPLAPRRTEGKETASDDSELFELLVGLAGEAGQGLAPEVFSEKLDRLGQLLATHVNTEELPFPSSGLDAPCSQAHIQEHNLMLEQYVHWQFELMKMNTSPRAEICKKIAEWLSCHVFASCPEVSAETGQERRAS